MGGRTQTRGLLTLVRNRLNRAEVYSRAEYWDAKAREHAGDAVSMWPNSHLNALYSEEQAKMLDHLLPLRLGMTVLDVGCGSGRMSRLLASRGAMVLGVDFSPETVAVARSASEGPNPSYAVGSVFDLQAYRSFDAVMVFGVLTVACRDRDQLLRALCEIRATLGPNGQLLLWEPIHRSFLSRVLKLSVADFLSCMHEAGFEVVACHPMHFWPARLLLSYVQWPAPITKAIYRIGQRVLRLVGPRGGDYKAILAKPVRPLPPHSA